MAKVVESGSDSRVVGDPLPRIVDCDKSIELFENGLPRGGPILLT